MELLNNMYLAMPIPPPATPPEVLLVEDDPLFARVLQKEAQNRHIRLRVCRSVGEMLETLRTESIDVAVIDYYLGNFNGVTAADLVEGRVPVLLISAQPQTIERLQSHHPDTIRRLLPKQVGVKNILNAALGLVERHEPEIRGKPALSEKWLPMLSVAFYLALLGIVLASSWQAGETTRPEKLDPIYWDAVESPLENVG